MLKLYEIQISMSISKFCWNTATGPSTDCRQLLLCSKSRTEPLGQRLKGPPPPEMFSTRPFAGYVCRYPHECMPVLCIGNWIRVEKRKENIFKVHRFVSASMCFGLVQKTSSVPLAHSSWAAAVVMKVFTVFLTRASWWAQKGWKEDTAVLLVRENQGSWKPQALSRWKDPDQMLLDIKYALLKALIEDLIYSLIKIW